VVLAVTLVLLLTMALQDPAILYTPQRGTGAFFRVIPYWLMTGLATLTFGWAVLALAIGSWRYWRGTASGAGTARLGARRRAGAMDILTLRNLGGGGHGCNDVDDSFSMQRRWFHQSMFFGFMLCFAATTTGAIYHHLLGWFSPHPFWSLPVQLGTWGGVGLCIGTAGLLWIKAVTDPAPVAKRLLGGEVAMLALLFLIGATGLLLLGLRHTGAMGVLLALHLGLVLGFFLVLPYSKMVHGAYRGLACCGTRRSDDFPRKTASQFCRAPGGHFILWVGLASRSKAPGGHREWKRRSGHRGLTGRGAVQQGGSEAVASAAAHGKERTG
jgi:citrate/tricarballylate utilization protein